MPTIHHHLLLQERSHGADRAFGGIMDFLQEGLAAAVASVVQVASASMAGVVGVEDATAIASNPARDQDLALLHPVVTAPRAKLEKAHEDRVAQGDMDAADVEEDGAATDAGDSVALKDWLDLT